VKQILGIAECGPAFFLAPIVTEASAKAPSDEAVVRQAYSEA
jgi:hypothetical protein